MRRISGGEMEGYLRLLPENSSVQREQIEILSLRSNALDGIHLKGKQFSRMDGLRYEMQKATK